MTFFFQTNPIRVILKLPWIFKVLSLQSAGVSVEQSMRHQINVCVYSINTHTHSHGQKYQHTWLKIVNMNGNILQRYFTHKNF